MAIDGMVCPGKDTKPDITSKQAAVTAQPSRFR